VARTPTEHSSDSARGAYTKWSNVADRAAAMADMHANSPSGYAWHARRLFGQDVDVANMTPTQWQQTDAARSAWLKANSIKAIRARMLKRAEKLRKRADAIDAKYEAP
jgi:hypothetical protein